MILCKLEIKHSPSWNSPNPSHTAFPSILTWIYLLIGLNSLNHLREYAFIAPQWSINQRALCGPPTIIGFLLFLPLESKLDSWWDECCVQKLSKSHFESVLWCAILAHHLSQTDLNVTHADCRKTTGKKINNLSLLKCFLKIITM